PPRVLVEVRIRKQPEADDACGLPVVGAEGHRLAARAEGDAGIFLRVGKRIGWTRRVAHVEPQAVAIWIWRCRLAHAGLVDEALVFRACVTGVWLLGVRAARR